MIDKDVQELRSRLNEGSIQRAYREISSYMSRLRKVFADQHGERAVSGIYQGYLDITYFAVFPDALKARDLKLAILFNYETFSFDIWLTGRNRKVQKYWKKLLTEAGYKDHFLPAPEDCSVAIVKATLLEAYSLEDQESLSAEIVERVGAFERAIVAFLNQLDT